MAVEGRTARNDTTKYYSVNSRADLVTALGQMELVTPEEIADALPRTIGQEENPMIGELERRMTQMGKQ